MPPYRRFAGGGSYPNAEWISDNGLSLPSAVTLKDDEVEYIINTIVRVMDVRLIHRMVEGYDP